MNDIGSMQMPNGNDFEASELGQQDFSRIQFDNSVYPEPDDLTNQDGPQQPLYNLQPPLGISVTTPSTVPQAYQPQQLFPKQHQHLIGSGTKGPDVLFRVQMGLLSGVASETDWCLSTLLTFTTAQNFDILKERSDIMESVINYIYVNWSAVTSSSGELDDTYETLRLRQKVLEALLIIRNVCIDQVMARKLAASTLKFVEWGVGLPELAIYSEIRLLCLEICEHVCFLNPSQSLDSKLFKSLIENIGSNDKAILIAAMRSLTRLLIFDNKDSSPLLNYKNKIKKIWNLLLIDDTELNASILDMMVQFTARLQRVEQISQVYDGSLSTLVSHLIRMISFKMEPEQVDYLRLPRRTRKAAPLVPPEINHQILAELLTMNEPERATMWIRSSYDTDPEGEVLQVSLWSSYQRLFEPHERDGTGRRMLKAIDFIRTCTTNVRGAQAKVISPPEGPKKFIIKGLVPRERAILPSKLLGNETQSDQILQIEQPNGRAAPVFGPTVALVLLNIAKLQGGKELLSPHVSKLLEAIAKNPKVAENIDRVLTELKK